MFPCTKYFFILLDNQSAATAWLLFNCDGYKIPIDIYTYKGFELRKQISTNEHFITDIDYDLPSCGKDREPLASVE